MLGDLLLPPGFRIEIALSGEQPPLNARVTAYRGDEWVGETTASTSRLDAPGQLQQIVDALTKRGVRGLRLEPKAERPPSTMSLPAGWRVARCRGGPLDGEEVGLKADALNWHGLAMVQAEKGEMLMGPPKGGIYLLDDDEDTLIWVKEMGT